MYASMKVPGESSIDDPLSPHVERKEGMRTVAYVFQVTHYLTWVNGRGTGNTAIFMDLGNSLPKLWGGLEHYHTQCLFRSCDLRKGVAFMVCSVHRWNWLRQRFGTWFSIHLVVWISHRTEHVVSHILVLSINQLQSLPNFDILMFCWHQVIHVEQQVIKSSQMHLRKWRISTPRLVQEVRWILDIRWLVLLASFSHMHIHEDRELRSVCSEFPRPL